jgi:predicted RNA methylase
MADFVQNNAIKSAVRKLANPVQDVTAFNSLVQNIITNNPFGCVPYMNSGVNHPPVEKTRETYTAKFAYEDANAKRVGYASESYNSIAGYNAGIAAVTANTANIAAHRGSPVHDVESDSYSATLKCHDPNGELYFVTFTRDRVTISSFTEDAIQARIETWADGVPDLA